MPRARGKKVKINQVKVKENEKDQSYVTPFLQQEIISEILSYLPVDSLLRCKCVSKLWCTIIEEPKFIRTHLTRAKFFAYYDASEPEETFKWIASLDGLILEKSRVTTKYRIRNPATRQVLSLPDPGDHLFTICMFYVPNQDYKLVSVHREEGSGNVYCKLLTVSNDHTWKTLSFPRLQNLLSINARVVLKCSSNIIHIVRIMEAGFGDSEIMSIDVETECFSSVKIPRGFVTDRRSVHIMQYNEKIAIARIVEKELHIWVLDDSKKKEWAERKIVHPLTFMKGFPNAIEKPIAIAGSRLLINVNHQRLLYDTVCKKVLHASISPPGMKLLGYICRSSVYLKGMQPQQRNDRNE